MCKAIFTIQTLENILYRGDPIPKCYEQHWQELYENTKKTHKQLKEQGFPEEYAVEELERLNKLIKELNQDATHC